MLSVKPVKNLEEATKYFFSEDNYYLKDAKEIEDSTQWAGKGAQLLGLSGAIRPEEFKAMLSGILPTGQQLGKKLENNEFQHRPGIDLTFSAPKSVSILAEVGQDKRLHEAHKQAVQATMRYIEEHYAQARITKQQKTDYQKTGNLVVAQFLHDLSRSQDPQVHTHCIVMNATQRPDGQWRALASSTPGNSSLEVNGFLERVFEDQRFLGMLYRSNLAYHVQSLGYTLRQTHGDGCFEIEGVPDNVIQHFSKRRKDIDQKLSEWGVSGARASSFAAQATKESKKQVDRVPLREKWAIEIAELQFDSQSLTQQSYENLHQATQENPGEIKTSEIPLSLNNAIQAVDYAITHLSERDTTLSHERILNTALSHGLGKITPTHVIQAMECAIQNQALIPLKTRDHSERYTTPILLGYEQDTLDIVARNTYQVLPLSYKESPYPLAVTDEQKEAIKTVLGSHDRFTALTGISGTGKTALIPVIADIAKQQGLKVLVLTPTSAAAQNLAKKGLQTQTLSAFLMETEKAINQKKLGRFDKQLIMLDDTQIVCSRQIKDFSDYTEKRQNRALFIGDPKAYLPIEGGNPLDQLLRAGIKQAELHTILRQKHERTREAIENTLAGDISAAFDKIGHRISAVKNKDIRFKEIARHYATLSDSFRKESLVLMPSRAECDAVNHYIRERLQSRNRISREGIAVTTLVPHRLSTANTRFAQYYLPDHIIRFNQKQTSFGIEGGHYYTIVSNDPTENQVFLKNEQGREIVWQPSNAGKRMGGIEVFEKKTLEIGIGEELRWSRKHPELGLFSGEKISVRAIEDQTLSVVRENGQLIKLDMNDKKNTHFSYGYALTPYQTYYQTPQRIIAHHDSQTSLATQRSFYKIISQASESAWIYTDNKSDYLKTLQRLSGNRNTAIQAVLNDLRLSEVSPPQASIKKTAQYTRQNIEKIRSFPNDTMMPDGKTPEELAKATVQYGIAHLSEREATFDYEELFKTIMSTKAFGNVSGEHIEKALSLAIKEGQLVQVGRDFTTHETIQIEKRILALAHECLGTREAIASPEIMQPIFEQFGLNDGQRKAAALILQSTDALVMVQGYAGTGKTTMVTAVQSVIDLVNSGGEEKPYTLRGIAPTHTAVEELEKRGIPSQTLQSFLVEYAKHEQQGVLPDYSRTLFLLDEASMLSNQATEPLLKCVRETGAMVASLGDKQQLASPEAGCPFSWLQKAGIKVEVMKEIVRQKTAVLEKAVYQLIDGELNQAFESLEKQTPGQINPVGIVEIKEEPKDKKSKNADVTTEKTDITPEEKSKTALSQLATDYLARSPEERANTIVTTPRNKDRVSGNAKIREGLQEEGTIQQQEEKVTILVPRHFTQPQSRRADQYSIGDVLRFNSRVPTLEIEKGSYLTVETRDTRYNILSLRNEAGEMIAWQPHRNQNRRGLVEIYKPTEVSVSQGDLIRWTRTDKSQDIVAAKTVKIIDLKRKNATLQYPDGKQQQVDFSLPRMQHFDHAYVLTIHAGQGKTKMHSMAYGSSQTGKAANQAGTYVQVSRAEWTTTLYTDDRESLLEHLAKNTGEKTSALAKLGYSLQPKSNQKQQEIPKEVKKTKKNIATEKVQKVSWDAQDITQRLQDQAEQIVEKILGKPDKITPTNYRYGSKQGSLTITLHGEKRGFWYDFQTGEGGNLLSLIGRTLGHHSKQDFPKTLESAANLLGLSPNEKTIIKPASHRQKIESMDAKNGEFTVQQKRMITYAQQLEKESISIVGTLAERYLREHRGIKRELPDSLRFHPGLYSKLNKAAHPALLVIAHDKDGKTQAVQVLYLDKETAKKADVEVKKQTFGAIKGAMVTLQKGKFYSPTLIAEGVETGLSLREAMPNHAIKITLGVSNYRHIEPTMVNQKVIFCLDNDGQNASTQKAVTHAIERLKEAGKKVFSNQPDTIKTDYNDVLKNQGAQAIKDKIETSISSEYQNKSLDVGSKNDVNRFEIQGKTKQNTHSKDQSEAHSVQAKIDQQQSEIRRNRDMELTL